MSVDTKHPNYTEMLDEWKLVGACASGSREVKKLTTDILPAPGERNGVYDMDRYTAYLSRAIYTNVTGRTKQGLTGAAFRMPAEVKLPSGLEYMEENATGGGQSLEQLSKDAFSSLLEDGREALLADFPQAEEGLTAEQVKAIGAKASIKRYGATSLWNWRTEIIGGQEILTLAVLAEQVNTADNEFEHQPQTQLRVLRLDMYDGQGEPLQVPVYSQQLYLNNKPITDKFEPRQASGATFDFIPLFIIGAQTNDAQVDDIPLSDIAHVNVGHFRNSADLEENCFVHGQLTLGITTDLSSDEFKSANPNGIEVGANRGHNLGTTGGFTSVQADANQLADKLQERKEGQMLALGARLVEQRNPNETAAAAKIDATGESSVLGDLVANVEEGVRTAVQWCGLFMGEEGEVIYDMNRQFFDDETLTPEQIGAQMALWQGAAISKEVLDMNLVKGKAIPSNTNLNAMNNNIENEAPGLDLDA